MDLETLAESLASGQLTRTTLADGSSVILDTDSLQVLALNETGTVVVTAIENGATRTQHLVEALLGEFEVSQDEAQRDLTLFLAKLGVALEDLPNPTSE